jgi:hypothetical protein
LIPKFHTLLTFILFQNYFHWLYGKFPIAQNSPTLLLPIGARQVLLSSNDFEELRRRNRIALPCFALCCAFSCDFWRVWRSSLGKKIRVFHEERNCVKFCVKSGKFLSEIFEMLKKAFGEKSILQDSNFRVVETFQREPNVG